MATTPSSTGSHDNLGFKADEAEPEGSAWVLEPTTNEYYLGKDCNMVEDADYWPSIRIPSDLYHRLYPHQKLGVQWMASMHENVVGGILGKAPNEQVFSQLSFRTLYFSQQQYHQLTYMSL